MIRLYYTYPSELKPMQLSHKPAESASMKLIMKDNQITQTYQLSKSLNKGNKICNPRNELKPAKNNGRDSLHYFCLKTH